MNVFWLSLHTDMEAKLFLCLILLCGFATVAASEVHYIIRPSQSQNCPGDPFSYATTCVDNELTLSQFVSNSSHYLTNDTTLIFSPRNYSLESELNVENVHSFSMFAWPASSSKAVITCDHNARFEFRNISTITVSGLEFVGCFENHMVSVGQFQLENSGFFGSGEAMVNSTVLSIEESTASLDRVAFVSVVDETLITKQVLWQLYRYYCTELAQIVSTVNRAIGISVTRSNISITQSWFEGNNVGLFGGVIFDEFGSDITIVNTTFINNSASDLYGQYTCECYSDCSNITSSIVYANGHGSTVKIHDSKFIHNVGVVLFGQNSNNVLITHTKFLDNEYQGYLASIYATHTNLTISHSTFTDTVDSLIEMRYGVIIIDHSKFTNNTGSILTASKTDVSISQSEFSFNKGSLRTYDGANTSIDHSKFINNTGNRILDASNVSVISVTHSEFIDNTVTYSMLYLDGVMITVSLSEFINNTAWYALVDMPYHSSAENFNTEIISIDHSKFINNTGSRILYTSNVNMISVTHCEFVDNNVTLFSMLCLDGVMITVSLSEFINNTAGYAVVDMPYHSLAENFNTEIISIDHSKFTNNTGNTILYTSNVNMISVTHSEFVDNTVTFSMLYLDGVMITVSLSEFVDNTATYYSSLLDLDGVMITVSLSEFINNTADYVVYMRYYTSAENLTNNLFFDNSAAYEINISPNCRSGLSLSLGNSRCIPCSENWLRDLIGIVVAAFIAGIALVILMLALNMTVAVGTLNGILFYANIVAANAETYFVFTAPNFVTIFISWLNLDVGFDICFFNNEGSTSNSDGGMPEVYKALLQLAFPSYVIFLAIIVIVASECSSKFAKIIGKGNPVAVLATMILLSYTKFLNANFTSVSLLYWKPAHGSRNLDITRSVNGIELVNNYSNQGYKAAIYFLLLSSILIAILCIIFTALVFSWQWLLRYQNKATFKWVRYQKLCLFLEPYHAPYTAKYRYWTGLLLLVRALLYLISAFNFSLDPRVVLMAVILVVGGLILLKGVTAMRVYKNWPLDVMETAIYFNLVAFSVLTWYNLDFGGNQVAVAYTSVMIIFILLLVVIVFHVLCYTRLSKLPFVEKAFKWTSSKLLEKKPKEQPSNDAPEELDGYRLERSAPGDQELPTITYSVIEINQPAQNQEENNEENYTG